jgi:hypothetical protein
MAAHLSCSTPSSAGGIASARIISVTHVSAAATVQLETLASLRCPFRTRTAALSVSHGRDVDELIRASKTARNSPLGLESMSDEDLLRLQREFDELRDRVLRARQSAERRD